MRRGVTVIEVLVVIVICLVVAGGAAMLIARHRDNALRAQCHNNLREVGVALKTYYSKTATDETQGFFPPSRIANGYATWAVLLAPALGKDHPLAQWDLQQSYFAQDPMVREDRLIFYFCPARTRADTLSQSGDVDSSDKHFPGGLGDYASVAGDGAADRDWTGPNANGPMIDAEVVKRDGTRILNWKSRTGMNSLTRGESYTLIIGEKHVPIDRIGDAKFGDGSIYNGTNPASFARVCGPGFPLAASIHEQSKNRFGSWHKGICQFLLADASVRVLTLDTSEQVLGQLARR